MGGVTANNSSGMACSIEQNTYQTLELMTLVLASGAVINSAAADTDDQLRLAAPELWAGLSALRAQVLADE